MTDEADERPFKLSGLLSTDLIWRHTRNAEWALKAVRRTISKSDVGVLERRDLERFALWTDEEREAAQERWIRSWATRGRATARELSQFRAVLEVGSWMGKRAGLARLVHQEILHNDDPWVRKALRELRASIQTWKVPPLHWGRRVEAVREAEPIPKAQLRLRLEDSILAGSGGEPTESRIQAALELAGLRFAEVHKAECELDPTRSIVDSRRRGMDWPELKARSWEIARLDAFKIMAIHRQDATDRYERLLLSDPGFKMAASEEEKKLVETVEAVFCGNDDRVDLGWPFSTELDELYPGVTATARSAVAQVARNVRLEQTFDWAARWRAEPHSRVDRMIRGKVAEGAALAADTSELGGGAVSDARLRLERLAERLSPGAEISEASRSRAVDTFKDLKKALGAIQERANVLERWAIHRAAKVPVRAPPLSAVPSNLPVKAAKWAAGWVRHVERRVEVERSRSV